MKKLALIITLLSILLISCSENEADVQKSYFIIDRQLATYTSENNLKLHQAMENSNLKINFLNEDIPYEQISNTLSFEILRSLSSMSFFNLEEISFRMMYDSDDFVGEAYCKAIVMKTDDGITIKSLQYDPIQLVWDNVKLPTLNKENLLTYINQDTLNGIEIITDLSTRKINSTDIIDVVPAIATTPINMTTMKGISLIKTDLTIITATTEATVKYIKNYRNTWEVSDVKIDERKTVYELPEELKGVWRGNYQANGEEHYAELMIDELADDGMTYKGRFYYGKSYPHDQLRASYEVTIEADLTNNELSVIAGNWINTHLIDSKVSFAIKFDDDDNLVYIPKESTKRPFTFITIKNK